MWALRTVSRQRRSLIALALLLGLVGAIVLGATAGARRTASASARFREDTRLPEGFVNAESLIDSGATVDDVLADLEEVGELPGVNGIAPFAFMAAAPVSDGEPVGFGAFVPLDERFGTVVALPLVHQGRAPSPDAAGEVTVNAALADLLDVEPGDRIQVSTVADFSGETPGPDLELTITGVATTLFDLVNDLPLIHPTPAFFAEHREEIAHGIGYAVVDLAPGADGPAFVQATREVFGGGEDVVVQTSTETPGVQETIDAQALALRVGAVVFAFAAVVVVGQAVARHAVRARADAPVLRAIGVTRAGRAAASAIAIAPAALGGALLALVLAFLSSPFTPIGVARRIEPDRGFDFDATVLLGGATALVIITVLVAVALTYPERPVSVRSGQGTGKLTRGLRAPADLGVRRALRPRRAVLSRIGTIAGLAGVVAALVFGSSLTRLMNTPERYGIAWDGELVANSDDLGQDVPSDAELAAGAKRLESDEDVVATTVAAYSDSIVLNDLTAAAYGVAPSAIEPTVVRGRAAVAADEVTLGRGLLEILDLDIGDEVIALGTDHQPVELLIVGEALFPLAADNGYDTTAGLTLDGFEQLAAEPPEYRHLFEVRDGTDPQTILDRHKDLGLDAQADRPPEVSNLRAVDGYPWAFAMVLLLMAAGAVTYSVTTGIWAARREIGVLRTIGFTRRDVGAFVRSWILADLVVALVLAVLTGLVIGLRGWAVLAQGLHVATDGALPAPRVAALVLLVLAVGAIGALLLRRLAMRQRPSAALRVE